MALVAHAILIVIQLPTVGYPMMMFLDLWLAVRSGILGRLGWSVLGGLSGLITGYAVLELVTGEYVTGYPRWEFAVASVVSAWLVSTFIAGRAKAPSEASTRV